MVFGRYIYKKYLCEKKKSKKKNVIDSGEPFLHLEGARISLRFLDLRKDEIMEFRAHQSRLHCHQRGVSLVTKPDAIFVRTSWSTRKPSRAHKRVKHILFGRNSRAIQRMLFIWFIARSVISNMSVLPRPNLKLDLEIKNLL